MQNVGPAPFANIQGDSDPIKKGGLRIPVRSVSKMGGSTKNVYSLEKTAGGLSSCKSNQQQTASTASGSTAHDSATKKHQNETFTTTVIKQKDIHFVK